MYRLINEHIGVILDAIDFEPDVHRYVQLMEQLPNVNVAEDDNFQSLFRRYWQLNPARLSEQFLRFYFDLLERLKRNPDVSLEAVARQLYQIPTQGIRQTLQFSFSSKLIHMLRPNEPVYDSTVEAFFFLPKGSTREPLDQKLERLLSSVAFLQREYCRILQMGLLNQAIADFRMRYDLNQVITDEKTIDTLIWQFVKVLRSGAVRDQLVTYD
jgi:hypothetical protein